MQRATASPHSSSLPQIVCDWRPSKLTQLAAQFSDSCSKPQSSFSAYHSYKAYFEPLLLAELSADLCSALDKYQRASLRQPKVRARREEVSTTLAVVSVQKVTRVHTHGFGWAVDLESHDRRGPVGCVDNDVIALWPSDPKQPVHNVRPPSNGRIIPPTAVLSIVIRTTTRTGCRIVLTKFPDGNENGVRTDLEDGEENEEEPPAVRVWNLLRIGSLTTMKREFHALQTIKNSTFLPKLLRPNLRTVDKENSESSADGSSRTQKSPDDAAAVHRKEFHSEYFFTDIIASKTKLNPSQARAIIHASTCRDGFAVIQGPPGTGKTKTLIGLLNVIHMVQYQKYYESVLAAMDPFYGSNNREREIAKSNTVRRDDRSGTKQKGGESSLLKSMMVAMNKTVTSSAAASENKGIPLTRRAKRPRLLICAPSNSAVDEILTRLMKSKLLDGRGNSYCPELARIGAGDRVSEAAKPFTAEGQAESFLDEVCGEKLKGEEQKKIQMAFLSKWQQKCNALLVQLERTPKKKTPESHAAVIELHEKLERMERDLRRLSIAASDGDHVLSREEKLRQIARTYVEDAQLVFATLSGSASSILTKKAATDHNDHGGALFDTVIIDEAAQASETSSLIPMTLGASRCILVGDPQQLPATVLSSGAAGLAYGQSLLERVVRAGQGILLLDTQYRMHPAISSFPRRYFYNGRLVDDESVQGENRARPYHRDDIKPKLGPYVFLDISEGEERRSKDDRSIFNPAEAELAALIYTKLKKDYAKEPLFSLEAKMHGSTTGFGVVTPYKRQMQELRQSFDRAGIPTGDVEVDTVDSFQGREKDVIVFSCVRTASVNRGIGFVRDVRRMNVGLTRARASLIILGSAQALAEGSADWAELVEDASSRGCLITVTNVSRCLMPPSALVCPKERSEASQPLQEVPLSSPAEANASNNDSYQHQPERTKKQTSHRVDPRTRANRKLASMPVTGQTGHGHLDSELPHASDVAAPPSQQSTVKSNNSTTNQGSIQYGDQSLQDIYTNSGLQSTLQQMTKLFSDAGFKNTKAVEETLREHLQNGGQLDVETVMAAAIATGQAESTPHGVGESATPVYDEQSHSQLNVTKSDIQDQESFSAAAQENRGQQSHTAVNQQKSNPEPTDTGQNGKRKRQDETEKSKNGQPSEARPKPEPQKKSKKNKKERVAQVAPATEPSGWDMLFGGAKSSNGKPEQAPGKKPKVEKAQVPKKETVTKEEAARTEKSTPSEKCEASPSATAGAPGESGTRDKGQRDKDSASPRQAKKKRWNVQNERDEKRGGRTGEFGGRGDFRGGRGADRGRHHSKRPRGPRQDQMDHGITGAGGYGNDDGWAAQVPYDPSLAGFPMVPNVIDQNMGSNSQAMLPMEAMQQQAMQQQLMQQQALQQQAMQQQVFQQQLQQQAIQQEAFRQQALMMQMSAGGMQHPGMGTPYPGGDFDGFNGSGGTEAANVNDSGNSWGGYGNNSYGRRGRGRGRGRSKGGRGRRY